MTREVCIIKNSGRVIDLGGSVFEGDYLIKGPITNIKICNGTVKGEVRLRPDKIEGRNTDPDYVKRIQQVSPSNIELENLIFDTNGESHQVYFGPGSTFSKVINCKFRGNSLGPSIYLSPEGGNHVIQECVFNAKTGARREVLSIDGSANNLITKNTFRRCTYGGIYVYRNCGEDGNVRHQKPKNNKITYNKFDLSGMIPIRFSNGSGHQGSFMFIPYGIILGSRQGDSSYCELDNVYDVGSGKSDLDFARRNLVIENTFKGDWFKRHILDNDKNNTLVIHNYDE